MKYYNKKENFHRKIDWKYAPETRPRALINFVK